MALSPGRWRRTSRITCSLYYLPFCLELHHLRSNFRVTVTSSSHEFLFSFYVRFDPQTSLQNMDPNTCLLLLFCTRKDGTSKRTQASMPHKPACISGQTGSGFLGGRPSCVHTPSHAEKYDDNSTPCALPNEPYHRHGLYKPLGARALVSACAGEGNSCAQNQNQRSSCLWSKGFGTSWFPVFHTVPRRFNPKCINLLPARRINI